MKVEQAFGCTIFCFHFKYCQLKNAWYRTRFRGWSNLGVKPTFLPTFDTKFYNGQNLVSVRLISFQGVVQLYMSKLHIRVSYIRLLLQAQRLFEWSIINLTIEVQFSVGALLFSFLPQYPEDSEGQK
jgi:hypothetical protein